MRLKPLLLSLPLAVAALSYPRAETPEPFPAAAPKARNEILLTGGAGLPAPSIGVKFRRNRGFETGLRLGWFPTLWTAEIGANFFADNPEPEKHGTWYGGLEFVHYMEDGKAGKFQLDFLDGVLGRESRINDRLRWAWEAGPGVMVYHKYQGGGPPILLPVIAVGRAELRYALL